MSNLGGALREFDARCRPMNYAEPFRSRAIDYLGAENEPCGERRAA
jgi:hypothetical protein